MEPILSLPFTFFSFVFECLLLGEQNSKFSTVPHNEAGTIYKVIHLLKEHVSKCLISNYGNQDFWRMPPNPVMNFWLNWVCFERCHISNKDFMPYHALYCQTFKVILPHHLGQLKKKKHDCCMHLNHFHLIWNKNCFFLNKVYINNCYQPLFKEKHLLWRKMEPHTFK